MIEYFYVSGDSFAFGQELGPANIQKNIYDFTFYHRKHCYSGIMADSLPSIKRYRNKALPGGSNERAYRKTVTNISEALTQYKAENIFVNVSLTHAYRREFFMNETKQWYPHMYTFPPKREDGPFYDLWDILVKEVSDDIGIYTFDMLQVLGIQNFLIKNKIPYLLTSSMGNDVEKSRMEQSVPKNVLDQIYKHRYYNDISFHSFTGVNGYARGPGIHPLEEAHKAWANHLLEHIHKNDLFSNKDLL